jgi:ribosomal protein S21
VEKALRKFKKKIQNAGLLLELRERETYQKPTARRKVKKGQAICDVIDPANPHGAKGRTTFTSQTDGVLFSRRLDGYLSWPGQVMYRICGPKPLPHRIGATGLDD